MVRAEYRWLICLFVGLFVLFYAVPLLPVYGTPLEVAFSLSWLCFCLLMIGANLYALLSVSTKEKKFVQQAAQQPYSTSVKRTRRLPSR